MFKRISQRLIGLALLAGALAGTAGAQDLFLADAHIVDPARQEIRRGNLLILAGRVAGEPAAAPEDFQGTTLDASGKWVIPGLVDLHTHSYGNMAPGNVFDAPGTAVIAERMLAAGVTAFLDLFGGEDGLYALRERQRAGEAPGADLFASLSCLTATKGHCTEYGTPTRTMDSPAEARGVVTDLAQRRPDVVKIVYAPTGRMPSIDKATLAAAIATASKNGIQTVIHVESWQDVWDAAEAGASAVTHVPDDEPVPEKVKRLMAERGVRHIPTLAVQTDFRHFLAEPSPLDSPLARAVAPAHVLAAYRDYQPSERAHAHASGAAEREARVLASVKALSDAGVTMLAGTDSGNFGTIQGFSVHRELLKLVQAGLTPWQALAAATVNAGEFLGRPYGVSPGDEANLVRPRSLAHRGHRQHAEDRAGDSPWRGGGGGRWRVGRHAARLEHDACPDHAHDADPPLPIAAGGKPSAVPAGEPGVGLSADPAPGELDEHPADALVAPLAEA